MSTKPVKPNGWIFAASLLFFGFAVLLFSSLVSETPVENEVFDRYTVSIIIFLLTSIFAMLTSVVFGMLTQAWKVEETERDEYLSNTDCANGESLDDTTESNSSST